MIIITHSALCALSSKIAGERKRKEKKKWGNRKGS